MQTNCVPNKKIALIVTVISDLSKTGHTKSEMGRQYEIVFDMWCTPFIAHL